MVKKENPEFQSLSKVYVVHSEVSSIIRENVRYSNKWWSATTRFTSFFSYTERFHAATAQNLLTKMNLNGKFLDIGFGSGQLIKKLSTAKLITYGVDISLRNIASFRKNFRKSRPVYTLPIDPFNSELGFKEGSFSGIVCSHVLEHVPDDQVLIKEIHRVLCPGGIAVIMVPINEEQMDVPTHIRKYTVDGIKEKLKPYFEILQSGENDVLSHYVRVFGIRKNLISTVIKRSLIFVSCFIPSKLTVFIDKCIIKSLKITKETSQTYILARKI